MTRERGRQRGEREEGHNRKSHTTEYTQSFSPGGDDIGEEDDSLFAVSSRLKSSCKETELQHKTSLSHYATYPQKDQKLPFAEQT